MIIKEAQKPNKRSLLITPHYGKVGGILLPKAPIKYNYSYKQEEMIDSVNPKTKEQGKLET